MSPEIEIVGGASEDTAAAILAAIQVIIAEEEASAKRAATPSRWRAELPRFERSTWGVRSPGSPDEEEQTRS